ncbi:AAA family ATPase [Xanthomarina sp. F1114]|uniref:McrB family protein n=1 Tax=Xanthomarina sp. F1114 TaxID=2996019 RepID=UPI00225E2824|nr:AAA family ATPase [Xanthomarina sp. F1114]MCX7549021.1 AAA family ATPase [Xanthomarina sp. F1114]
MEEQLKQLVVDYKNYILKKGNQDEVYKWNAIVHFQEHWDFDAPDFYEMFKEAFRKKENLMFQNSYGFLDKLGKQFPDKLKRLFSVLLNKNSSFNAIYKTSRQFADEYLLDLKQALNRDNLSHQLDERAISFICVLNNPEKFYLYKANVYDELCSYFEINKVNTAGEKYDHFVELGDQFVSYIQKDEELLQLCNNYIPETFGFNSEKLIFQDIVYNMLVSLPASIDNKKFLDRLFYDIKEELESEEHPLIHHKWLENDSESYRQVSIIPDTSRVSTSELHYELYRYSNKICFEVHPEGDLEQKRLIQSFINEFPNSKNGLKLSKWHTGIGNKDIDKGEHFKLVPKTKISYSLKQEEYEELKSALIDQFKSLYDDFNDSFLEYLETNNDIMEDVKEEFINWYIDNPRSSYFNNEPDKIRDYLTKSLENFSKNIFLVNYTTYREMIDFIEETINNDKPKFLKNHGASDSGKLAAIIGKRNYQKFLKEYFNKKDGVNINNMTEYKAPLNQIFYGPPGTGKTYNTILEAAKIITQDENISYNDAQMVFNNHLGDRIEFITFHQNYSYEDFIQGLRPDTELSGELSFFTSDGVFKKIADKALKNLRDAENPDSAKKEFIDVFGELIKPLNEGDVGEVEIKMKQTSFYVTEVGEKSIEFRKNQGDSKHTLSIATLKKMYDKGENDIILGGLQPYYNPILKQLIELGKRNVEQVEKQNYVIIIDEINRANISRVFGELITLIEKDKRSHGKIPLTATLPSGESFIVPSNLYLIGTMNTADKSIALLDIALRRRFEFVPMYPDYNSTADKVINDANILEAINKEIISRKGHDFTIGHSYFMGEDYDLKNTIDNKVIPLLLEYFMNDFEEVKKILSAANIFVDGWPMQYLTND